MGIITGIGLGIGVALVWFGMGAIGYGIGVYKGKYDRNDTKKAASLISEGVITLMDAVRE